MGGFLNVLAFRSLNQRSFFNPTSQCDNCQRTLGWQEAIPLLSYICLKGRCRSCQSPIPWHYPLVEALTALSFIIIVRTFGTDWYGWGMLFFISTLITVSITDFQEKLIPHEITYPAILVGIVFSISIRHDIWSTLAGIGISYIFFDFLAFYGLKVYLWLHKPRFSLERRQPLPLSAEPQIVPKPPNISGARIRLMSLEPTYLARKTFRKSLLSDKEPLAEIEVIGGGDAVLSALISAWLGLNRLIYALVLGFIIGTLMGMSYLLHDLHNQGQLKSLVRPTLIGSITALVFMCLLLSMFALLTHQSLLTAPFLVFLLIAAALGALFGIVSVSSRVSKPFPFGPALAAGAAAAIFCDPLAHMNGSNNW